MPPKRIPIADARDFSRKHEQRQVIIVSWDGETTHVITYGKSIQDCDQAALGGEKIMQMLKFEKWQAIPSRVRVLQQRVQQLEDRLQTLGWHQENETTG
jgi:hypothetical protein